MKKFLSAVLALAMAFALCTTAFAATSPVYVTTAPPETGATENTNMWKIPIDADAEVTKPAAGEVAKNYYVVVEWSIAEGANLKYTRGADAYSWVVADSEGNTLNSEKTGTPAKAGYQVKDGTWAGSATVNVTVTNWSNDAVVATLAWVNAKKATTEDATTNKVIADITANETFTQGTNASKDGKTITLSSLADGVEVPDVTTLDKTAGIAGSSSMTINGANVTGAISAKTNIGYLTITLNK